jgi:3-oxoadipate enol-lactonase
MQLAYDVHGPDDGPPVVLVGSLGTTTALWREQIDALSAEARLVCVDLPGHGRSQVRRPRSPSRTSRGMSWRR